MPLLKTKIAPGGMMSDVAETALGVFRHQEIKNFRISKDGEWSLVNPYKEILTQFTNVRSAIEITEDRAPDASDRFVLIHWLDGATERLTRVDYDDTLPTIGYTTGTWSNLTLPAGVTLSSTPCKFFYYNGILRISDGTSEPLWYGYIDREIFPGVAAAYDYVIAEWYLGKAKIVKDSLVVKGSSYGVIERDTAVEVEGWKLYYFLIYDNGQYSLLNDLLEYTTGVQMNIWDNGVTEFNLNIHIIGEATWPSRVTGVGIVAQSKADLYKLIEVFYLDEENEPMKYSRMAYRGTLDDPNYDIYFHSDYDDSIDGYFYIGAIFKIKNAAGAEMDTITVTGIEYRTGATKGLFYITVDKDIHDYFPYGDTNAEVVYFELQRNWTAAVVAGKNEYVVGIGVDTAATTDLWDTLDIPAGTEKTDYNYSFIVIANNRSYIMSKEADEGDTIRYSPEFQFDVFPEAQIMSTQVGDKDSNKALAVRDDRVIIFKSKTVSQGQLSNGSFSQDVGFYNRGLYSSKGFIVIDNILYWMDYDDIYAFDGQEIDSLTKVTKIRKYYQLYVSSTSHFMYDKINDELLCCLNGKIIVFDMHHKIWYIRDTTLAPVCGMVDFDNKLMVFGPLGIYGFNETTGFSENIGGSIKSRLEQVNDASAYKLLERVDVQIKSNAVFTLAIQDPIETRDYSEDFTPSATDIAVAQTYPNLLFRGMEVTLSVKTADDLNTATIRGIDLLLEAWK